MLREEYFDGLRYYLGNATRWHRDYSPPAPGATIRTATPYRS